MEGVKKVAEMIENTNEEKRKVLERAIEKRKKIIEKNKLVKK
jgi:hypothetical protein